jgi:hypothetical protein
MSGGVSVSTHQSLSRFVSAHSVATACDGNGPIGSNPSTGLPHKTMQGGEATASASCSISATRSLISGLPFVSVLVMRVFRSWRGRANLSTNQSKGANAGKRLLAGRL